MIIITGSGRSGTTMLVKALAHAGIETGPMTDGFGEHLEAIAFNRIILKTRGYFAWERLDEMANLVRSAIESIAAPVLKQTDLCHTLDVWWKIRQDIRVIVCHRRLDATRKSFVTAAEPVRQDLTASSWPPCTTEVTNEAWMPFAFGQLMDILLTNAIPHEFFRFPEDLGGPRGSYRRMAPILGDLLSEDQFVASMEATRDPSQVHW